METQQQELASFIESILGNDNRIRQENESLMNKLVLSKPNEFIESLLSLLANYHNPSVRSFCAVAIRKYLSFYSDKSYQNIWGLLQPPLKEKLKSNLFSTLEGEQDMGTRHQICDAIGEIASGLINSGDGKANEWPELVPYIMELLMSEKSVLMEAGLKILSTLFLYAESVFLPYKEELVKIFKMGIESQNPLIQTTSIEALSNFLSNVGSNHVRSFEILIPGLLEATYSLFLKSQNYGESALKNIEAIAEAEPKYFRRSFGLLFEAMKKIFFEPSISEMGKKKIATETLLAIAERIPKLYRDDSNYVRELIQILFYHMIDIDEAITTSWESPEEGFNADIESDSDYESVLFGTTSIDKLIASLGEKSVLPILSILVQTMMEKEDWRCKHAGIMALSQVGEYLDQNVEEIKPIITLVLSYLEDQNPKIRYAACHCIGQIASDMKPIFQTSFHEMILPSLINCLHDPIPRVHAHAAAAITNFVEGMSSVILKPYLTNLLTHFYEMIQKGISIVKENAISALAATAESAQEEFKYYYKNFIGLLFKLLESHSSVEYRHLTGVIIECLTLIVHAIGKEDSQSFIAQLIKLLMNSQETVAEKSDPLKLFILWGWQRLFLVLKKDLSNYLDKILPPLLQLLTLTLTQEIDIEKEEEISPEISSSISLISTLVEEIGNALGSNILTLIQLILPVCTKSIYDDELRKSAAKILPKTLEVLHSVSLEECKKYGAYFVSVLIQTISEELEPLIIKELIIVTKDCICILGNFMNEIEFSEVSKKIIKVIYDSDQRKDQEKNNGGFEDLDSDELELIKERINNEEDLQIAVAQLIGILFKTHRDFCLKFADFLYSEVVLKVFDPSLSDKIHKLGLVLIDDMMEYLGRDLLGEKWIKMAEILVNFIADPCCTVRQTANYGVGLFAAQAKEEFKNFGAVFIEKMIKALNLPQKDEKQRPFMHCRDNIIAAIGKIIYFQGEVIDLGMIFRIWVFNLPIRFEKFECYFQHEFLALLALNKKELIFQDQTIVEQVIKVFAEILDSKFSNPKIKNLITMCLRQWITQEKNEQIMLIFKDLSLLQQKKIEDCLR